MKTVAKAPNFTSQSWGRLLSRPGHVFDMALVVALGEIAALRSSFLIFSKVGQSSAGGVFRPCHIGAMKNRPLPRSPPRTSGMAAYKGGYERINSPGRVSRRITGCLLEC